LSSQVQAVSEELDVKQKYTVVPGAGHPYDEKVERPGVEHIAFFGRAFAGIAGR
jgi:hypothetical protein